jgi:hypothetical protein
MYEFGSSGPTSTFTVALPAAAILHKWQESFDFDFNKKGREEGANNVT